MCWLWGDYRYGFQRRFYGYSIGITRYGLSPLGTMEENKRYCDFDETFRFLKNKPLGISGNLAKILRTSRFCNYFTVEGEGETHYGLFKELDQSVNPTQYDKNAKITARTLKEEVRRYDIPELMDRVKGVDELYSKEQLTTMQVNVGYRCNLSCAHCFLECGPDKTEMMSKETMDQCLQAFKTGGFRTMDITGGSPEMNPNLTYFIEAASKLGDVIVRTNLVILQKEAYAHLIDVYTENKVRIVCSLPYYNKKVVEKQRGAHVFDPAIKILQELNARGYGRQDDLRLTLVYNTDGPYLPPNEFMLEKTYREILEKEYGIVFTDLIAIGNVPIGRFIPVQSVIVVRQDMEAAVVEICHIKLAVESSAGVICRIEKELFGNYENDF